MRVRVPRVLVIALSLSACSSTGKTATSAGGDSTSGSTSSASGCSDGSPLAGASYDIANSRFAFGSMPVAQDAGGFVRWVGSQGVVAIQADGSEMGIMNAGAAETSVPDWSPDPTKLVAHATEYWASMGVAKCQIAGTHILSSISGGGSADGGWTQMNGSRTVEFGRSVDGIWVIESLAAVRIDANDETTSEAFYWPEIPADVVSAAIGLRKKLSDPSALAAYKAKLPADAQGDGSVVIHHSHAGAPPPFRAAATYDVVQTMRGGGPFEFDANGQPVTATW